MGKKVVSIFLVIISLLNYSLAYSNSNQALSLDSLIEEARSNSPELLAAKKRYEAAKARVPQAKALDDPIIGVNFMKTKSNPFNLDTTPGMDRMLSIKQAFPFFGKLSLKGKIALVESQMFAAEYTDTELEVINKVKNNYYGLFINYKARQLKEESLEFLSNIAEIAEARYTVGDASQEEIFKIHSEIASLSNEITNLKHERSAIETRLNTLLNREPESRLSEPELAEDTSFNMDIDSLYKATLENQPVLLIFSYAIERNKHAKSLAKRSFFPDFLAGLAMRGFTTGSIGPWDMMLAFTLPIWFWTKQRYEVKEAINNLEQAEAAYEAMENKAFRETKDLFSKINIAKNQISLYRDNLIPLLENSIQVSLAAFRSGEGDFMMLLDNERMLIDTKLKYFKALVEYNMNLADLEKVAGLELREVKE